jgi:hypothetical protein
MGNKGTKFHAALGDITGLALDCKGFVMAEMTGPQPELKWRESDRRSPERRARYGLKTISLICRSASEKSKTLRLAGL